MGFALGGGGFVTDSGQMVVKNHGEVVADLPASKLADDAPIYHREAKEPAYLAEVRSFTLADVEDVEDPTEALEKLLEWPSIASKNWVYRQYDHMVRANTMVNPGSDAAVIRIKADSVPGAMIARTFPRNLWRWRLIATRRMCTSIPTKAQGGGGRVRPQPGLQRQRRLGPRII